MITEKENRLKTWEIRRGSISQLRDLKERQNYLKEKLTFFQDAMARFEKNRIECELLCQELFNEFLLEVNFHFQKNFQRVFNGGRAKIEIEEQNLEIVIQIPGKKKQRLSLLSSGEKALTALCLFFALFKSGGYRFCFFDEVDATLDHFNSVRLADLMKEFSHECQIIIVTHQEEIMEEMCIRDREEGVGLDLLFNKQQELLQEKEKLKSQILERLESLREELRSLEQQIYFHLTEARQREKNKLLNREALNAVSYTHLDVYKRQM